LAIRAFLRLEAHEIFTKLPSTLHKGEGAALSIARTLAWGCLTDDQAARRQARLWNVPLSGTIGVLLSAVEDQLFAVEEANKILRSMIIKAHYRSPINDLSRLL
jgi:predicted nucleic acid-binding protein